MTEILLVRHGETEENVAGILQGQRDGMLTALGSRQAALLGTRLRSERIDAAYSSDLSRARDTASAILAHHAGCPVQYLQELRERAFGCFEGEKFDNFKRTIDATGLAWSEAKAPGGESLLDVRGRASRFLERVLPRHRGQTVLICAHGGYNRAFLSVLLGRDIEEMRHCEQHNTCLNRIRLDPSSGKLASEPLLNCIVHLDGLA